MSTKGRVGDWTRKVGGVDWRDIWAWCDELRDDYGYWADVIVSPPLPSQKGVLARVTVVATRQAGVEAATQKITASQLLSVSSAATVQEMVLQMVCSLVQQLDREVYQAESAAVEQGLLL